MITRQKEAEGNIQIGRSLPAFKIDRAIRKRNIIGRDISNQGDSHNFARNQAKGNSNSLAGRDITSFRGNEIRGNRNVQSIGNNIVGCNQSNNQIGSHNTQIGQDQFHQVGGKGNMQVKGKVTINKHYNNTGFEALFTAYLELQAKYIALLESKAA